MSNFEKASQADDLFKQKKFEQACTLYEEADEETPNCLIKLKIGECQFNLGRFAAANL